MWTTRELVQVATADFGGDFIRARLKARHTFAYNPKTGYYDKPLVVDPPGDPYTVGQIGTVQAYRPGHGTVDLGSFRYLGNDYWTPVKPGTPAGLKLMYRRLTGND
jgi:hypothetical protein